MSLFIGEPWIQLSILLGDSSNLREGLVPVYNVPELKIRRYSDYLDFFSSIKTISKAEAVHIQALMNPYRPKNRPRNLIRQSL
jgi:hypothetical protein